MLQNSRRNTMATSTTFYLSFIGCIAITHCVTVNLFGADPSGGLWGARVDTEAAGQSKTPRSSGYQSNVFDKFINTASYDTVTKKILFHTVKPDTLYYGPLCPANRKSPRFLTNLTVVPLNDATMGDCVNCETSAFATHNGTIYFLLYGDYISTVSITRLVEIRAFTPCDECGDTGKKFKSDFKYIDVVKCSKLVVNVMKDTFTFNDFDDKEVKGAKSMKVIAKGNKLSFFFQLGNIVRFDNAADRVNMSLWYANTDGVAKELHTEVLASRYSPWDMRALGSVDVHEKTVCWTAGDRLLCGEFEKKRLKNSVSLISTGEAASSEVCKGPEIDKTAIVSGVAISETGPPMSVVFGCYPQSIETGGVGIVAIDTAGEKTIQPVGVRNEPLLAGSVFLTKGFDESCTWEPEFDICLGQPNPVEETPEPEVEGVPRPEGEPDDGNEIPADGEYPSPESDSEENEIEGGQPNKHEETKAVVGDSSACTFSSYVFTLFTCLITLSIASLLS